MLIGAEAMLQRDSRQREEVLAPRPVAASVDLFRVGRRWPLWPVALLVALVGVTRRQNDLRHVAEAMATAMAIKPLMSTETQITGTYL